MDSSAGGTTASPTLAAKATTGVVLLAVAAVALLPALVGGFPKGHDWVFELLRVAEYEHALLGGQIPPSWAENTYRGYGSPTFTYYAPLFVSLAATLALFGIRIPVAAVTVQFALAVVAAWGVYGAATAAMAGGRSAVRPMAARVGAYLFVLHPYIIGDALLRNACAEYAALCVAPLALWGILAAGATPTKGGLLVCAGLALAIVGHNLTALVVIAMILAGGIMLYSRPLSVRALVAIATGTALALALTLFFWLPALWLKDQVSTDRFLSGPPGNPTKFDFHHQFPSLDSVLGFSDFYSAGLLHPAIMLVGLATLYRLSGTRPRPARALRILWGLLAAAFILLFLAISASTVVWENVPLMAYFGFPWRMNGPAALATAVLGAILLGRLKTNRVVTARIIEGVILTCCVANAVPNLARARNLSAQEERWLDSTLTPSGVRRAPVNVELAAEYIPVGADPNVWRRHRDPNSPIATSQHPVEVSQIRGHGIDTTFVLASARDNTVVLARWALPSWHVTIDDEAVDYVPKDGAIMVAVPAGTRLIRVFYEVPTVRTVAFIVSIAVLLGCIGVLLFFFRHADIRLWRRRATDDSVGRSVIP